MKFAQQLKALERTAPDEWRGKFLHYKALKKLIKVCRNDRSHSVGPDQMEINDRLFFKHLQEEVKAINRQFESAANALMEAGAQRNRGRARSQSCMPFLRRKPLKECGPEQLAARSVWCRQYALVNAAALRKVTKKHDKYCGGSAGSRFLQACWDASHGSWGGFLHSPLMTELQALEESLVADVARQRAVAAAGGTRQMEPESRDAGLPVVSETGSGALSGGVKEDASASRSATPDLMSSPEPELQDGDLMCSICLGPLFKPLGLSCGHKFCAECVIQAAGMVQPCGHLKELLKQISEDASCPECRQKGVFAGAVELKRLGRAVALRYPDEIKNRVDAAVAKMSHIQNEIRSRRMEGIGQMFLPFGYGVYSWNQLQ